MTSVNHHQQRREHPENPGLSQYKPVQPEIKKYSHLSKRRTRFKFSTYSTWWIRQSIERGIANDGRAIRLPVHFRERLVKVLNGQRTLRSRLERDPRVDELASTLEMSPAEVQAVLDWAQPMISIDAPVSADGDLLFGDLLDQDANIDGRGDPLELVVNAAREQDVASVLDHTLSPRSAMVVRRRFGIEGGEEQTLDEIGKDLGLTRERIRQLASKALVDLSVSPQTRPLYEYLIDSTKHGTARPINGWESVEPIIRRREKSG